MLVVAALSIVVIMTFCFTFMFPYRVHNLTNYLNIMPTDVFKEEQASKEERATDAILN